MRFTIERSALVTAVAPLKNVIRARNTIPIFDHVLISAATDGAKLAVTDMDMVLVERVTANVENEGTASVPATKLSEIAKRLPTDGEVKFERRDGHVHIRAGRANVRLPSFDPDNFPSLQIGKLPYEFTIEAADLFRVIENVRFAMAPDDKRYYLCGVYLHTTQESLRAVATDGNRLAMSNAPLPAGAGAMPGIIVPDKTINLLHDLLKGAAGEVFVAVSDRMILATTETWSLASKLIEGTFPDYERAIPTGNEHILNLDRDTLAAAVALVSSIMAEKTKICVLEACGPVLIVSARGADDNAEATQEIVIGDDHPPVRAAFQSRYLTDVAGQVGPTLGIEISSDPGAAAVLRDPDNPNTLFVVMTCRG